MPIWVKSIFMLWVCFAVMHLLAMIYADEIRQKTFKAKLSGGELPWYLYIYGIFFLACVFSLIPLAAWFIFFR